MFKIGGIFCVFLLLLGQTCLSAKDFDPKACPDLSVKIFPGNGGWSVLHATSFSYMHNAYGYDFTGVLSVESQEKHMQTYLRMDMGLGKSSQLDFLMTVPNTTGHNYALITKHHWLKGVIQTVPLETFNSSEGKIVFRCTNSIMHHITIDLKNNTAECHPSHDGKLFSVEWNKDGFNIKGLPKEEGKFEFVMPSSKYRGCNGGVTIVRRKIGTRCLLFPVYQTFYLESDKE